LKEILGQWIYFEDLQRDDKQSTKRSLERIVLDVSKLRSFSEGDAAMEKELVGVFISQSDINLQTLADTCAGEKISAWQEAGHMFKGGALGIGAENLAALCNEAQHMDGTADERTALFEKINAEYARVKAHLREIGLWV
jgi:HPt (histidine-containing phosphotransfer) domain-containing protein